MRNNEFSVEFPIDTGAIKQDKEYCILSQNGKNRKIRFHDYQEIFDVPGLYEFIFHEKLKCESPHVISTMLSDVLEKENISKTNIKAIEIGAGNGVVGEALFKKGISKIVGIDILHAAARAATRDRPHVYEKYRVLDLTDLSLNSTHEMTKEKFNCLVCVAALGFSDIPPLAFIQGFNFVSNGGWVTFNIKDDFVQNQDSSGFNKLINEIIRDNRIEIKSKKLYRHRDSSEGKPLNYFGYVGKKISNIPS